MWCFPCCDGYSCRLYWHIVFLSIRACSLAAGFGGLERLFLLSRLMM